MSHGFIVVLCLQDTQLDAILTFNKTIAIVKLESQTILLVYIFYIAHVGLTWFFVAIVSIQLSFLGIPVNTG
jgi:hypothetical protein